MSKIVTLCGGRKAFGFYAFLTISTAFFAAQSLIGQTITFRELAVFWEFIFASYIGGNLGEHYANKKSGSNGAS